MRDALSVMDLDEAQAASAQHLVEDLRARHPGPDDEDFLRSAPLETESLPRRLRAGVSGLRHGDMPPAALIRGFPVDDGAIGPTPGHWRERAPDATEAQDYWLALLASLLGEPFCWSTLQDGRLYNDIHPIRGSEQHQTGHGSESPLEFHTEDAFHEYRCDYILLLSLRNHDRVPTTLATSRDIRLSAADRRVLFERRFVIRPDTEHRRHMTDAEIAAYEEPVAVLFGDRDEPGIRIDPPYMEALPGDEEAAGALAALGAQLEAALTDVPLGPGDVLVVDNQRCVHGRKPFRPRLDGTDRWLRKVTVTRDLRKSAARHRRPRSRVLRG
ncbi:guanitoxin biosynthesis L-enduracididine beta-hydroxylase GntD [Streptomyces nanshensis]|nr:guanitoxin biosynthesis L-enduracididine beta-hydroxylase GntD [Streptomyces nanshensis]